MSIKHIFKTSKSKLEYYASLNETFRQLFGKFLMLHFPFYNEENESLEQRQINLTNYCVEKAGGIEDKTVLDVGCGNGTQSIYLALNFRPARVIGIDLIPGNIAKALEQKNHCSSVEFYVDDAQQLNSVTTSSIDFLLCIESAFHYPDKELFIRQIKRVLKPGGKFVIADILNESANRKFITPRWKRKMSFYNWTAKEYRSSMEENGIQLLYEENITSRIIKGYQGHERWFDRDKIPSFYRYIMFRLFAFIYVSVNVYNLKKKEDYFLFIGSRD